MIGQKRNGKISIHAPRGGSDHDSAYTKREAGAFQSTLPVGGATKLSIFPKKFTVISIHAPRGGSDRFINF